MIQGDSGSGLLCENRVTLGWELVGVTSYGDTVCALDNEPTIYTRVTSFLAWVFALCPECEAIQWSGRCYQPVGEDHPVLVEDHPVLVEDYPVLVEDHPVLVEDHPVLGVDHPVLVEDHPVLGVDHPVLSEDPHIQGEDPQVLGEDPPVCHGGDYCCSSDHQCEAGQGDCWGDQECKDNLVCRECHGSSRADTCCQIGEGRLLSTASFLVRASA